MSTNVTHDKPETEEQPTVKKLRIEEDASSVDSMASAEDKTDATTTEEDKTLSVDAASVQQAETSSSSSIATPKAAATTPKPAASGFSAFSGGGFGAFSGGGFAGFAKTSESSSFSSGFGSFASSDTSSGFSGFAKTAESSGFGAFARADETSEGFAETASADVDPNEEESAAEFTPVVSLTETELMNGEEEERVVVEKRAKLFKLVGTDYTEVGVGPFRVLKAKTADGLEQARATARMVMRRESYPRGPGTKLILNARLTAFLSSVAKSEKSLMVVILEHESDPTDGAEAKIKPVTYLIRFGTNEDLLQVQARVKDLLPERASSS